MSDKSLLPPRYANVPVMILFDFTLPEGVRDTYAQLRALAWRTKGKETPPVNVAMLVELTGKKQSTVYKHLAALDRHGALQLRRANSRTFSICFTDAEASTPVERLIALTGKESRDSKTKTKNRDSTDVESSTPGEPGENGAGTRAIQDEYVRLLGYKPSNWAQGEAAAAKQIGACYSVDEFRRAYLYYKSQSFWRDKRLSLRYLKDQIPEFMRKGGRPHGRDHPAGARAPASSADSQAQRIARELTYGKRSDRDGAGGDGAPGGSGGGVLSGAGPDA